MKIMECRQSGLEQSLDGLNLTDIPLVSFDGAHYGPAGFADDLGIYYFIPKIAHSLGLSIDTSINLFFGSLLLIGALLAFCSFFFTYKRPSCRLITTIAILLLTIASFRYSDVYIAFFFATAATLPLLITQKSTKIVLFSLIFSGIILGYSNFIRSHSGTGVLLFSLTWIALHRELKLNSKLLYTALLLLFSTLPYLHFQHLEHKRDQFLSKMDPEHEHLRVTHPKWHAIYLGLGYLKNDHGIEWSDRCAWEKAFSINPKVKNCSEEYGQILRDQCWQILKKDPAFVLKTLLVKLGLVLLRFLVFANFGCLFYFYVKPGIEEVWPFLIAAAFYSLPGILVMPTNAYLAGLTSVATLFGLSMICLGLESEFSKKYA